MGAFSTEALSEPTRPVSLGFQVLLGLANAGAMISLIPVLTVAIPAQVTQLDPANAANNLALVLTLGAVAALVGNPLAGALSDRTTSRFGRRRPWLLTGTLGVCAGLALLALSQSIPLITIAWCLVQFFGNMLVSSYIAILPDRVPVRQRGTTQAIIGLASPAAIILVDVLITQVKDIRSVYLPIIAAQAVLAVLFIVVYKETQLPEALVPPFRLKAFLASFWVSPRKYPIFTRAWLMWFLFWLGYNVGTGGFFFLYVQNITRYESLFPGHLMKEGMAQVQMVTIAVSVPLMMALGVLSDRIEKRKPFVLAGAALIVAGLAALIYFSGWPMVLAASIVIGAGFMIYYNLGLAMITQILPSASGRGKDLGVINIASTLPQIIMPSVGAVIINGLGTYNPLGYQVFFGIGLVGVIMGIFLLRTIRK